MPESTPPRSAPRSHSAPPAANGGPPRKALVVGASGFVGRHLIAALNAAGVAVRATCRAPEKWQRSHPEYEWVRLDLDDPDSYDLALDGCDVAFFLVQRLGTGKHHPEREAQTAQQFRDAASGAGVERIIYLGGIEPTGGTSRHLASRLSTGRILRDGSVPTIELRAAMIIGAGSTSWQIVRDLAARLPAMVLPRWLDNASCPIDVTDVVYALVASLSLPVRHQCWDIPGPERLSHRTCLQRTARLFGREPPIMRVPVVAPNLSSYWITWITRAQWATSREFVEGLRNDLTPTIQHLWPHVPPRPLRSFDEAARMALLEENEGTPSPRQNDLLVRIRKGCEPTRHKKGRGKNQR